MRRSITMCRVKTYSIKTARRVLLILPLAVAGCQTGPYDPSAHHHADAPTGSMLSGTGNDNVSNDGHDPSISSNGTVSGGR